MTILRPGSDRIQWNSRLLRNSNITRFPKTQHDWNSFILEFNKHIPNYEGSFTPTFTGFSTDPTTPIVNWVRFGPMINVRFSFLTGTSDTTTLEINNLPEELRPDTAQIVWFFGAHDNGSDTAVPISVQISNSADLKFGLGVGNETGGGWTSSSAKGIQNTNLSISYSLWSKGMSRE